MVPKPKKKITSKEKFDEYGFRILGDDDEAVDVVVADPKAAASKGCRASNDANKALMPANNEEEKEKK